VLRYGSGARPADSDGRRPSIYDGAMEFELSDDQLALRDAARGLLDDLADHDAVRAHVASGQPFDASLWAGMAEQGWLGVALPEGQGGLGLGWVEAVVLVEELGRHAAPVPFLPSLLALSMVALADDPRPAWLADLASGERIGCAAWSHGPSAVTARRGADGWELSGRAGPVEAAAVADIAVVATPTGVFAVDLAAVGRPRQEPAMDLTRCLSWLDLDGAPAIRLGGEELVDALLDLAAVGTSASLLGGCDRVLEMSVQYAKDRVQFGQPIGSFQAIKHRSADMVVDVEGMRSTTWYAAWALAADDGDRSIAASTAKTWCSDAAKRVMASALQIHGGIGFTWEHDLHLFLKRSQFERVSYGDASYHRERLSGRLRARLDSGAGLF